MKKLCYFLCICLCSIAIHAEVKTGTCGDNLTWSYDSENQSLTITGSGAMTIDFSSPWYAYSKYISTVFLPDGLTSIGEGAFNGCTGLTSVTIPNSVTSIGEYAFYRCSGLTSVTIPNSVTSIGRLVLSQCSSLTSIIVESGNSVYDSRQNCNAIVETATNTLIASCKGTIIPNSVTSIGEGAFKTCIGLTSITIPESVTSIGSSAFYGCNDLTSVTIPESVTSIGVGAFKYCTGLTSLTIPNSVTSIGSSAFKSCTSLTSVIIGNSVTSIESSAFQGCSSLTSVTIPNSVTNIKSIAFNGCTDLTSVTIPNSVTSIGYSAFQGCSSLTSLTIPNSVTSIGSSAFQGCSSLTSVTIPNSVTSIENGTFSGCTGLTSLTIPNSVTSIATDAFNNTPWYEKQPDGVVYINNMLYTYKGTMSANTSIVIIDDIIYINQYAFSGCSGLTSITIPESVTRIGWGAFKGCTGLTSITCEAITPPVCKENAFYQVSTCIPVYIPCGTIEKYRTAYTWRDFTNLQEPPMPDYTVSFEKDGGLGYAQVESRTQNLDCKVTAVMSVTPELGCHFVQWGDGNTDNPRTILLTQDTTFMVEFALDYSGKCGDNLYWQYLDNELRITGSGTMYNYTETTQPWLLLADSIYTIYIDNTVTSIGEYAFANLGKLTKLHLGAGIETIGANAFAGCLRLGNIYSYAALPPLAEESSFVNYNARLYVPCEVLGDYQLAIVFGNFKYIDCISSDGVDVPNNTVTVTPSTNDATFTWPSNNNANAYTLEITKDGVVFCTLTFNANGQLMGIAFAPSKDRNNAHAPQAAQATVNGWQFTVTGLNESSNYAYTLTVADNRGTELQTYNGTFRTLGTTALDNINAADDVPVRKILRNGQVFILRGNEVYTVLGEKVK